MVTRLREDVYAYDIECLLNCFTVTFLSVGPLKLKFQFVISNDYNHLETLCMFLRNVKGLVGFNNIGYDSPIMAFIYDYYCRIESSKGLGIILSGEELAVEIYTLSQEIITEEIKKRRPTLRNVTKIQELDMYLLYHFNNEARRTSLKWIQCHLNMRNVQDMPIHFDSIVTKNDVDVILGYNTNDVETTREMFIHPKTQGLIALRKWAIKEKGLINMNISNSTMGEQIFMKALGDIKSPDRSNRRIRIKDLILPVIKFKHTRFQDILRKFQDVSFMTASEDSVSLDFSTIFDNMKYKFGMGGIHAARPVSRYQNVDTIDAKSFYPSIAIRFGLRPAHLGVEFNKVYEEIYNERMASKDKNVIDALKEALNSVFGKSNSEFSELYDPAFTFAITVNGQLLMTMLAEDITLSAAGEVIMVNTDGMEVIVKDRTKFNECLERWQKITNGIRIESDVYKDIMIKDVNNYIAITNSGKVKMKGEYEIDKEWHKDPSGKILSIAAKEYFVNGVDIKNTILSYPEDSSYFYMFRRAKTGKFTLNSKNAEEIGVAAPKTIRYVASMEGWLLNHETDARKSKVHDDTMITILNDLDDIDLQEGYLNRRWYVQQARKLIIEEENQLSF